MVNRLVGLVCISIHVRSFPGNLPCHCFLVRFCYSCLPCNPYVPGNPYVLLFFLHLLLIRGFFMPDPSVYTTSNMQDGVANHFCLLKGSWFTKRVSYNPATTTSTAAYESSLVSLTWSAQLSSSDGSSRVGHSSSVSTICWYSRRFSQCSCLGWYSFTTT